MPTPHVDKLMANASAWWRARLDSLRTSTHLGKLLPAGMAKEGGPKEAGKGVSKLHEGADDVAGQSAKTGGAEDAPEAERKPTEAAMRPAPAPAAEETPKEQQPGAALAEQPTEKPAQAAEKPAETAEQAPAAPLPAAARAAAWAKREAGRAFAAARSSAVQAKQAGSVAWERVLHSLAALLPCNLSFRSLQQLLTEASPSNPSEDFCCSGAVEIAFVMPAPPVSGLMMLGSLPAELVHT